MSSLLTFALALVLNATLWGSFYLWRKKRQYQILAEEFDRLRRAERDLRENEAFSESLFQATHAGLMIIDSDTRQIMDINRAGACVLGGEPGDIIGMAAKTFVICPPEGQDCQFATGSQSGNRQVEFTRLDGTNVPVLHSVTPMWGQSCNLVVASFLDIRELKEKEKELVEFNEKLAQMMEVVQKSKEHVAQSEKLASIGQLAAGVAHEINNPIGFITSNLGTIREYSETTKTLLLLYNNLNCLEDGNTEDRDALKREIARIRREEDLEFIIEDLENVLTESLEGVNRVAEIVQNLKSFARTDNPTLAPHDINEGLDNMIRMVWNELKYHCTLEKDFGELPLINCHPGQIDQVLMNILVNAGQAIGEEGGAIQVSTSAVKSEVMIKIADTGKGIPADMLSRIFDPFFTTKEVGKGTGLGLSISHGIIQDHGGRIEVDSVEGEGTEFLIYLPLTTDSALDAENKAGESPESELIG